MIITIKTKKKKVIAELKVDSVYEKKFPDFVAMTRILNLLNDLLSFQNSEILDGIVRRLEKIAAMKDEFSSISSQLNGPCHHLLSLEEQERLIRRHKEILATGT